jgi:hypothetical protein
MRCVSSPTVGEGKTGVRSSIGDGDEPIVIKLALAYAGASDTFRASN